MSSVDKNYEYKQIAKERTIWLIRPLVAVLLIVWCLHPSTAVSPELDRNVLLGFLGGALFCLFVFRKVLFKSILEKHKISKEVLNRVPDEYYLGRVEKIMDEVK